jgi:hypothetical protein
MRVPWRDRPWDEFVCDDPLGNSSCTLLGNIGRFRQDQWEQQHRGQSITTLDHNSLPCLTERATFMSPTGYTVIKNHPYAHNAALKGHLKPTPVHVPAYAFEALPFRWLNRSSLLNEVGLDRVPDYDQGAEDAVDGVIKFSGAAWVMDGANQRACIDAFFDPVEAGHSLVFMYLKHSPLQEHRTDRLLAGVARVKAMTAPPMWNQVGTPPFESSMWETIVEHTLRPEMTDGILLPYQKLTTLLDDGVDIDKALAWAPAGRDVEFSYVTEHLSDDAALEALAAIDAAARGARELGLDVPDAALAWLEAQTERLWQVRGPVPGLAGVLQRLGVEQARIAARVIVNWVSDNDPSARDNPWPALVKFFANPQAGPAELRAVLPNHVARLWRKLPADGRDVLQLLSSLDISAGQVDMLFNLATDIELDKLTDLLDNPYFAATCTYGQVDHVPFLAIDRALYPPVTVTWDSAVPASVALDGARDRRRIEALITDVLERAARDGDTLLPLGEVFEAANAVTLTRPPNLDHLALMGADLDHESLDALTDEERQWSPLFPVRLANDAPGYKLTRLESTGNAIRDALAEQLARPRLGILPDPRTALDAALASNDAVDQQRDDPLEEPGRREKAAGLSVLHDCPLSILIGPAGTGKTTLLKALVDTPGVADGGVLLLAPTGKARVQLQRKVGRQAHTLASWLAGTDRYDFDSGRYLTLGAYKRRSFSLVVIDEASMLTEEMLAATLDAFTGVKRLILVGDPRQLPPIGAGRPFVDLIAKLQPDSFEDWIRVGDSYVELQVTRRQTPDGSDGTRHDLALAAWFGDESGVAADDEVWATLAAAPNQPTLRFESWAGRSAVQALTDVLVAELGLTGSDGDDEQVRAFADSYGATLSGQYTSWEIGAGVKSEAWQVLSPTRTRAFGTVELNRHIKRTWRSADTAWAQKNTKLNIPSPYGPEMIVRGDKVMQTRNDRRPKAGTNLNYIANGEIGVGIGPVVHQDQAAKRSLSLSVEFSSQPGDRYRYWPTDSDSNVDLELAWAVTVHKSQGSEFAVTIVVLPARVRASRELLYTALTRQRDRVVIVSEGSLDDLRELAQPWRSETARRLTDLFVAPDPATLTLRGATSPSRFDRNRIHISTNGIAMRSKNEVIIAELLERLVPGRWNYEEPLIGADGGHALPDFTIMTGDGRKVIWEHAGMLDRPDYARRWERKKQWYADNGFGAHADGGGTAGTLMWTESREAVDAQVWLQLAREVLGVGDGDPAESASRPRKQAAKKIPPRRR